MRELKDILKKNNIRASSYDKKGNSVIVSTLDNKFVIKKNLKKEEIFTYLDNRNFNYYPKIYGKDNEYEILEYIDEVNIPMEQKMNDLMHLVSLLHNKTTYYKEVDYADYKNLYEDLLNNCEYLYEYYNDMLTIIESKVYMSPSEYLLALNSTLLYDSINYCKKTIDIWYEKVQSNNKMRVCVIHNNLSLDHYLKNDEDYLISWHKSKIDIPIFDLYKLYLKTANDFDFSNLLSVYEKDYPLKDEEILLLYILISLPKKIEFTNNIYYDCVTIQKEVDKLMKTSSLINDYKKITT